ncbi:MAG: SDR family oxidoreductase [Lentimicrobium sp.]|nr:SDR family oxidoreductase [Lentimicrobium sp.]
MSQTILITGATGTIGSAMVQLLSEENHTLILTGRNAGKLLEIANEYGIDRANLFEMDITSDKQVAAAISNIILKFGVPDVLINATGIGVLKPIESLSIHDFNQVLDVNLTGAFRLLKAVVPAMKERKTGLIIHLPGVLGKTPMAGAMAYAASKYGLNGMIKSLREELKRTQVKIVQLFVGGVDSHFWDNIDLKVQREKFLTAFEIAKAVKFLLEQPAEGVISEMVIQPLNHQAI